MLESSLNEIMTNNDILRANALTYVRESGDLETTLWDEKQKQRLIIFDSSAAFRPIINEQAGSELIRDWKVSWRTVHGYLEVTSEFTAAEDCELNRLDLFPPGTALNLYDAVNFRNRHFTPRTWPELNLGGSFETTTYSTDWQFAPHPSMMLLRKGDVTLLVGALDLPEGAFGLELKVEKYRVVHWHLNYGPEGQGKRLRAGETFRAPRFALFLDQGRTVYETVTRYSQLLIQMGAIPDPTKKERHMWHTEPLYCTWIDQCALSQAEIAAELNEQEVGAKTATSILNENLVRHAINVIQKEKLPFRTILLDEGWQIARGQWEPHPERFPRLRRLVDEIHAAGMKAIVWWAWPEIADDSVVDSRFLTGCGLRNRHKRHTWDFSNPVTRKEYLEPLFRRLFSSEPDCYNLDGIKTDFTADKIHPEMPLSDENWRGEENYFVRLYRYFYELMRRFKPDACHIGCAGHPWLAEFIDINRTFDVASSDWREHEERAKMLAATTPDCSVTYDFHNFLENLDAWFASAARNGSPVQIGNLLMTKRDKFSEWEPASPDYYEHLRSKLQL